MLANFTGTTLNLDSVWISAVASKAYFHSTFYIGRKLNAFGLIALIKW